MESNYVRLCRQWEEKFLEMDQARLLRLLPELTPAGEALTLRHFGRLFSIDRRTGRITAPDGGDVTCEEQLNIFTLLGYCREGAAQTGRWVPFREVPGAAPFAPAFDRRVLRPLAATFSGRRPALRAAAAALGGTALAQSDAGFLFHAFDCIPMQLLFWDGDDEFPAQSNLLFDRGVTGYIHVESTVTLAGVLLHRLAQSARLPIAGGTFVL